MKTHRIEITTSTILKTIAIILGLWLAYYILDVIILLFVVVMLTVALEPIVTKITLWGVPKVLSIIIVFVVLIALFGLAIYIVIPPLVEQVQSLANNAPVYINKFTDFSSGYSTQATQKILDTVSSSLGKYTEGIVGATIALFGGIVSTLTVVVLTFYLLIEEKAIRKSLLSLVPLKNKARIADMSRRMGIKIGLWLRGQFSLMVLVGLMTTLAMQVIGAPYALAIGVTAGLLELVPLLGPIIAGALGAFIVFASGAPLWQVGALITIFIVVQQIENQILVPKIMQKAIGVSPVVVIIAILVGGRLLGVGGAVLAIPIVGIISVFAHEYLKNKKTEEKET